MGTYVALFVFPRPPLPLSIRRKNPSLHASAIASSTLRLESPVNIARYSDVNSRLTLKGLAILGVHIGSLTG